MPIPLREYKDGIEPEDSKLLGLLEKQPYQAYTLSDLATKTDNWTLAILQTFALAAQVDRLIQKGLVKAKDIGGQIYYVSSKAI